MVGGVLAKRLACLLACGGALCAGGTVQGGVGLLRNAVGQVSSLPQARLVIGEMSAAYRALLRVNPRSPEEMEVFLRADMPLAVKYQELLSDRMIHGRPAGYSSPELTKPAQDVPPPYKPPFSAFSVQ